MVKTIAIVRLLNEAPATLPDIAGRLDLTRSHCHNILRTLAASGWVLYDPDSRQYRLSALISADTAAGLLSEPYLVAFRGILDQFARQVGMPVSATEPLPDGSYLQVIVSSHSHVYTPTAPSGFRFPPGSPLYFKACLAWADGASRAKALEDLVPVQFTPHTIVDKAALARSLDEARAQGYAKAMGEFIEGFGAVGLPVFDSKGAVLLVVSCASKAQIIADREAEIAGLLVACVHQCHIAIDGRPPVDFPRP